LPDRISAFSYILEERLDERFVSPGTTVVDGSLRRSVRRLGLLLPAIMTLAIAVPAAGWNA